MYFSGDISSTRLGCGVFRVADRQRGGREPGADRPAEREIAAALESVFPRIGLKAFTALPNDDKVAQLHELANIVLGIRLFNRESGKGGAGLECIARASRGAGSRGPRRT